MRTLLPIPSLCFALIFASGACSGESNDGGAGGDNGGDSGPIATYPERVENVGCALDGQPTQEVPEVALIRAFPQLTGERPFQDPILLTHAPDNSDRIFVVEQGGVIWVFPNRADVTVADMTVFMDVTSIVRCCNNEEGLLGFAFHPNYVANGQFFIYFTAADGARRSLITRYNVTTDPNVGEINSGVELLTIDQPFNNHNGGHLAFGPDGYLYVGVGDGGSAGDPQNHAQDRQDLLGSILRIDVDAASGGAAYGVPADNPFVGEGGGVREEIFAYGLRNPWRFTFDRQTGDLWAGDVGQGEWEEINIIESGGNYGWRLMEGNECFDPNSGCNDGSLALPITVYGHGPECSVTGGFVYRGAGIPELQGVYIYGDYCSGQVFGLRWDAGTVLDERTLLGSSAGISSFGEDQNGELYLIDLFGGEIFQFARPQGAIPTGFPTTLSATGCYTDTPSKAVDPSLVPFDIRSPLWSDGTSKNRFITIPFENTITFGPRQWAFPANTILMKEFLLEGTPGDATTREHIETRFLIKRTTGRWEGYNYMWNAEGTEGDLVDDATTVDYTLDDGTTQSYYFPSRTDCSRCHNTAADFALGPRTEQLNGDHTYPNGFTGNQLDVFSHMGLFDAPPDEIDTLAAMPDPSDTNTSIGDRARSYLAANCSHCHQPDGPTPADMDLRFSTAFADASTCGETPRLGEQGLSGALLIKPGVAEESLIWYRMTQRGTGQMPPLATNVVDEQASDMIAEWINGLAACP